MSAPSLTAQPPPATRQPPTARTPHPHNRLSPLLHPDELRRLLLLAAAASYRYVTAQPASPPHPHNRLACRRSRWEGGLRRGEGRSMEEWGAKRRVGRLKQHEWRATSALANHDRRVSTRLHDDLPSNTNWIVT
jgi:hypothetical protein